jgi:WD40 repeat protein
VFADRGGPVVLMGPHWTEHPYEITSKPVNFVMGNMRGARLVFTLHEFPQPPAPVVDLRTGETVGEFSWKSPFWSNPRLSPDGNYLVGRDAAPYWLYQQQAPDAIQPEPNTLFAWKQKLDRPAHKLPVVGFVMWAEFVSNEEIAVFLGSDKSTLLIWNVATGKVTAEVPLSIAPYEVHTSPIDGHWGYVANPLLGAVSPGGRYVAVGGHDGISLISIAEHREVGTFPIEPGERKFEWPYRGMSFHADGEELNVIFHFPHQGMQIRTLSITTGATQREHQLGTLSVYGQITPGPEPGTLVAVDPSQGTTLFDGTTSRRIAGHTAIYRWSDSGPVVALGAFPEQAPPEGEQPAAGETPQPPKTGVFTSAAVHATFREALSYTDFGMKKRPVPVQPDRSGVEVAAPEPPANWTPPPPFERPAAPADIANLTNARPTAFGGKELAVVRLPRRELKQRGSVGSGYYYYEVVWERHDRLTGERSGETVTLWPWARNPSGGYDPYERMMAALSADDRLLALRDPASYGRVDVWNTDGERIVGFYPVDAETKIDWLGWDSAGRLLTLAGGVLSAWEVPAAKLVYDVDGRYAAPVDLIPGRDWLAISAGTHIDLLETATGKCLGRCAVDVPGRVGDIAVSPDGARLAAVYMTSPGAADLLSAGKVNPTSDTMDGTLVLWDLKTGKAGLMSLRPYKYALVHWGGPEHLALLDGNATIYDLRAGIPVLYHTYHESSWPNDGLPHVRSPDGRLWAAYESGYQTWEWTTTRVPDPEGTEDAPFVSPARKYFVAGDDPVQVEIDCGSRSVSEKFGLEAARALQMRGFKIGPAGWRLVVSHQVSDSGNSLDFGLKQQVAIPKVDFFWQLLDTKGTNVWHEKGEGFFPMSSSKYHTKTRGAYDYAPGEQQLTPFETMEYYDFGSRDPREAMEEEIIERSFDVGLLERLPKVLLEVAGQYPRFPASRAMAVKKAETPAPAPGEP